MLRCKKIRWLICIIAGFSYVLVISSFWAPAWSASEEITGKWEGGAEMGFVSTSGNTDTETLNGKINLVLHALEQWRNELSLEAYYAEDSGKATAERYMIRLKSDYSFSSMNYAFVKGNFENDRFAGFDYRVTETVGYGRYLLKRDIVSLQVEGGPGGSHVKFKDGTREDGMIVNVAGKFVWKILDKTVFSQTASSDFGEDGTITEAVTSLKSHVAGNLSMKVSLNLRHDSSPPLDSASTDTRMSVTLVYDF